MSRLKGSNRTAAKWSGRIPKDEAKDLLIREFGPECWGCGWRPPVFENGEVDSGMLEVDHIWARNEHGTEGGSDELYNLALLHTSCNRRKGNRITLEELRRWNAKDGRLFKPLVELVHLERARQFTMEYSLQRGVQIPRVQVSTSPPTQADIGKMNDGDWWVVRSKHPYVPDH